MQKHYNLGRTLDGNSTFRLLEKDLDRHVAVFGDIGSGKSRFLWQLLREHRRNRRGFCLIDPGDLCMDFMADCAKEILRTGNRNLLKKIHYVQLSPFQMPRYDPFRFVLPASVHPELRESAIRCLQHTKIMSVAEVFQRKQNQMDFEGMPRLQRIMTDVLTFVSTMINGRHLTLAQGQILLDMNHPFHARVYQRLVESDRIPREILADFEALHEMHRIEDQLKMTESSINRWRSLFGPAMTAFLSGTGSESALDLAQIIQRGDYLLVNVSKSRYASEDQNAGLAGLFIHDVSEAMLTARMDERRPFTLIIDEAHKYIADDIGTMMRVARKYRLGIVTSMPDLAGLVRKTTDLTAPILGIAKTKVAFCMTLPQDTETMARILYSGDLNFAPLSHEQERHSHKWQTMHEESWSVNRTTSTGVTESKQTNETKTQTNTHGQAKADGTSTQESNQVTQGAVNTLSKPKHGTDRPEQESRAGSETSAHGTGNAKISSTTDTVTHGDGLSIGTSNGIAKQAMEGEGSSYSVSRKQVMVPVITIVPVETGQLKVSIADQLEEKRQEISNRPDRQATVKNHRSKKAIEIETVDVADPFGTARDTMKMVEWLQRELVGVHDYYHTPVLDPAEQDHELEQMLNDVPDDHAFADGQRDKQNPLDG